MQDDRLKPYYLEEMLALTGKYPDAHAFWAEDDIIAEDGRISIEGQEYFKDRGHPPWRLAMARYSEAGLHLDHQWFIHAPEFTRIDSFSS